MMVERSHNLSLSAVKFVCVRSVYDIEKQSKCTDTQVFILKMKTKSTLLYPVKHIQLFDSFLVSEMLYLSETG